MDLKIGFLAKIFTGNHWFLIKIMGFSCKISLNPIHWPMAEWNITEHQEMGINLCEEHVEKRR